MEDLGKIKALANRLTVSLIHVKPAARAYFGNFIALLRREGELRALEAVEAPEELVKWFEEELSYQKIWLAESQESFAKAQKEYNRLTAEIKGLRAELSELTAGVDFDKASRERLTYLLTEPIPAVPTSKWRF